MVKASSTKIQGTSVKPTVRKSKVPAKRDGTIASPFGLGRVLYFGRKTRPKKIVVMMHGMGDNAVGCSKGWAESWAAGLPGAMIVVPEASERTVWDDGKNWSENRIGRDWHRGYGSHDVKDKESNIACIQRVARRRLRLMNAWLDGLLRKHGLTNQDLILTGFSQGTNVALITGANRGVKSVLLCGGPGVEGVFSEKHNPKDFVGKPIWPRWEDLLPRKAPRTKFWLLEATEDFSMPRCRVEPMMKKYNSTFRWEQGLQHHNLFERRFRGIMLRQLQEDCEVGR